MHRYNSTSGQPKTHLLLQSQFQLENFADGTKTTSLAEQVDSWRDSSKDHTGLIWLHCRPMLKLQVLILFFSFQAIIGSFQSEKVDIEISRHIFQLRCYFYCLTMYFGPINMCTMVLAIGLANM